MPPKPAAAPSAAPKAAKPPGSRPPGSKLPPLPPMRPLGTAPPAPAKPAQPVQRTPSMVTSVLGATSASGTVTKEEPAREASRPMPWDEQADDEPTKQIAIAPPEAAVDHEATGTHEIEQVEEAAPHAAPPHAVAPEPAALPLAVGVRVRLILDEHGRVIAEPDRGQSGVVALLVPAEADDDLRSLFQPRA
ncbi:MAG: hypothetical protein HYV09_27745 [Deltaproteobacteria bacterium]|nr:hypothetical protein [Deltaproteobacteria bacterium]